MEDITICRCGGKRRAVKTHLYAEVYVYFIVCGTCGDDNQGVDWNIDQVTRMGFEIVNDEER